MYYLTLDDVLEIHHDQITEFGGSDGARDKGLIEVALLRPQTGYYRDIIEEAAAIWESLTINNGLLMATSVLVLLQWKSFWKPMVYRMLQTTKT